MNSYQALANLLENFPQNLKIRNQIKMLYSEMEFNFSLSRSILEYMYAILNIPRELENIQF